MNSQEDKKLGLMSIILLGINTIVGSGIFLLPGQVTALVGTWSLLVYILASLMIVSIAWCFAKCAALFNRDGGAYLYAKHAFGDFVGFEIGLMRWIVSIISWASLAVGFVTALSTIWPMAMQEPVRSILILMLVGGLGLLNTLNLGMLKYLNNFITAAKLLPLLFFVGAGAFFIKQSNFAIPLPEINTESVGASILLIFYAFSGFEALVVPAGEMKNPQKNLPIAVMSTISICGLLYFSIQLIALGTLGPSLASSVSPIADVAEKIFGSSGKFLITLVMLTSIFGINLAASFIVPKAGVALAQDNMIPSFIATKNRFGTPYVAIIITVFAVNLMALSGDFVQLAVISAVSRLAQHITTCLAVLVFYKERLSFKQPLRKSLTMLIPVAALCGITWLIFQTSPYQLAAGLSALILGIPLYFLWRPTRLAEIRAQSA